MSQAGGELEELRLPEAPEAQLATVRATQDKLKRERDHLVDQVNRLQEARLDCELVRLEADRGHP